MKIIRWKNSEARAKRIAEANNDYEQRQTVSEMVPLSRTQIWRLEKAGKFPRRIKLSDNAVGWDLEQIKQWQESRKAVA